MLDPTLTDNKGNMFYTTSHMNDKGKWSISLHPASLSDAVKYNSRDIEFVADCIIDGIYKISGYPQIKL